MTTSTPPDTPSAPPPHQARTDQHPAPDEASTLDRARRRYRLMREPKASFRDLDRRTKRFVVGSVVTLLTTILLVAYLLPFGYMAITAVKSEQQISDPNSPILPRSPATVTYEGEELELLDVPFDDGTRALAMLQPGRQESVFIDPDDPENPITWEGNWRTLEPAYELDVQWDNFSRAWDTLDFPLLIRNTGVIAGVGMAATMISSTLVAYGLSRFRIRFKGLIIGTLLATIILPRFVTIVPTYALYSEVGLVGTWWPLLLPHFFANAYNVFLLRQFFLTIPRELDEAAAIDGASPMRTLTTIMLPQIRPAIIAVGLFHFFFAWNDFFEPLIYLSSRRDLLPISVGLYDFLALYDTQRELVQAGAFIGLALPLALFFVTQRYFLRGIDLSGSIK
ncbi:MAG: carbohydrate ABC transporter permease [Actinomycetota bacterium]|nr:carbohydrate ABC transporter permease [Actinomycetota bacterium]